MAVLLSAERDTDQPCLALPFAPTPTSFVPCWFHTPPLLVQTTAPPLVVPSSSSLIAPVTAVLPSPERATEMPKAKPTNLGPCCVQTPPLLVQIHAAPTELSSGPP